MDEVDDGVLPFAGATGRGVRVAVIDSGVYPTHAHIGPIAGGVSVDINGELEPDAYLDRLGHGTAVMAAIQEKAPGAAYFAVKVFHTALRSSSPALVRAIDWCIEQEMQVVNLSLGTLNKSYEQAFTEVADRAEAAGTLLVAAREANGEPCYPGCLPNVFGVDLDWECPRHQYRCAEKPYRMAFSASGYPRPVPGVPLSRNLSGISFAVANMTGLIARALEVQPADKIELVRAMLVRELS